MMNAMTQFDDYMSNQLTPIDDTVWIPKNPIPKDPTVCTSANPVQWKYNEDKLLKELHDYLASTYGAHYIGENNTQAMDLIAAGGMLFHFAASSIIKYAFRFGKKDGANRKDLLKIIHYAMFMLWKLDSK